MMKQHKGFDGGTKVELTCAGIEGGWGCRVSGEQGVEADDVLCVSLQ